MFSATAAAKRLPVLILFVLLVLAPPAAAAEGHFLRAGEPSTGNLAASDGDRADTPPGVPLTAGPATPPEARDYEVDVVLEVGHDIQAVVDNHPAGTTYLVAAGVHREQQVVPKDGDTFVGERGAVLSGARDLTDDGWTAGGDGSWFVGGQTQQGLVHGTLADGGNARHAHPEELFVDGERWTHLDSVAGLTTGTWHFDYAADRVYLGADPEQFGLIEISTTAGAFGGNGVSGVTIDNVTITQYATPAQHGAIGYIGQHHTRDWTVRNSTVVANHGAGIRLGPGMTVEYSEIAWNGQIGLAGDGIDADGYAAPITIRHNDIHHNLLLDYRWSWEGGAMKIKNAAAGSLVEHNWVHHNHGPGVWHDVYNRNSVIAANLIEDNGQQGILYEISHGDTLITGNHVRRNGFEGVGDQGAGIDISSSSGVTVTQNVVHSNRRGVLVRDDDRSPGLYDVHVIDNDVQILTDGWTVKSRDVTEGEAPFEGNRYYGPDHDAFRANSQPLSLAGWMGVGIGSGEQLVTGQLVLDAPSPASSQYGAR